MNENDVIKQEILIEAPVATVWRALVDYEQFGRWFQVKLDQPFAVGGMSTGYMTLPGHEHVVWEAKVLEIQEHQRFVFSGPPYAENTDVDLRAEPWLTTVFTLIETESGTLVRVVESGFSQLSPSIRTRALTGNTEGWAFQVKNLARYVSQG